MKRPLDSHRFPALNDNPNPWGGLVTSLTAEHDYFCEVEGDLPPLHGRLLRLGPGLYDRGSDRKRMVLDGDGMLQVFDFSSGKVRYRNRFIRTKKLVEEEEAGHFIYPTLSTHGSGSFRKNLGIVLPHQANITPIQWNNRLLVFDESQKPYELNPESLQTMDEAILDEQNPGLRYWAHWKLDPSQQQWHCLAIEQGPVLKATIVSFNPSGQVVTRRSLKLPRASYFHDWFLSENYFGFLLHPAIVSLSTLLRVGLGIDTFSDALKWRPEKGNVVFLIHRETGKTHTFELAARWMWHSVNTFQEGDELVADFIGNEEGGGLGDPHSPLFKIMENKTMPIPEQSTNHLVRYRMNLRSGKIAEQVLSAQCNYELPSVSAAERGRSYGFGHMIAAKGGEFFARGLAEWSQSGQKLSTFFFDDNQYVSEPLPFDCISGAPSPWTGSLIYNGDLKKSYLGIFKIGEVEAGPVAKVWLRHHVPLGFHGFWFA